MSNDTTSPIGAAIYIAFSIAVFLGGVAIGMDSNRERVSPRDKVTLDIANDRIDACEKDIARTQFCEIIARPIANKYENYGKRITKYEKVPHNKEPEETGKRTPTCETTQERDTDSTPNNQ